MMRVVSPLASFNCRSNGGSSVNVLVALLAPSTASVASEASAAVTRAGEDDALSGDCKARGSVQDQGTGASVSKSNLFGKSSSCMNLSTAVPLRGTQDGACPAPSAMASISKELTLLRRWRLLLCPVDSGARRGVALGDWSANGNVQLHGKGALLPSMNRCGPSPMDMACTWSRLASRVSNVPLAWFGLPSSTCLLPGPSEEVCTSGGKDKEARVGELKAKGKVQDQGTGATVLYSNCPGVA
mmetsp:Transcript_79746/g.200673  ORF Transcript_79746/g.200673 Transcript_79746/m.200673 type:complete len:242 (-) Transcript_79746:413-1138(-)